jgi:pimeloyl-ACP methyl ester carboxylesterase
LFGARAPVALALAALGGPLLSTAIFIAGSFAIARVGSVCACWREFLAAARIMLIDMPFAPGPVRRETGSGAAPVLLVHGFFCNRGAFRSMAARLAREGFPVESHDLEPVYASIDDYAPALAARIDAMVDRYAGAQLTVVCHSMGGLAMRAYLRAHGPSRLARLITLGTPHAGTRLARWGQGRNVRQMEPGSSWLRELAASEQRGLPVPVTAIYSTHDNIVAPQGNAQLQGAENVRFDGIGHVDLLFDDAVFATILRCLKARATL